MSDNISNSQLYSDELEKSFLCCLLSGGAVTASILADTVSSEFFYDGRHQVVFEAACAVWKKHTTVDVPLVWGALRDNPDWRKVEIDLGFLSEIADYVPTHLNWQAHLAQLLIYWKARRANKLGAQVQKIMRDSPDVQAAVLEVADAVSDFQTELVEEKDGTGVAAYDEFLEDLEKYRRGVSSGMGIATGWGYLDKILCGVHQGENMLVAARPGQGKTVVGLNLAENIAVDQGIPVLFFSAEMGKKRLMERMASSMSRVNIHKFRTGFASEDDFQKLLLMRKPLEAAPFYIVHRPKATVSQLINTITYYVKQFGVKVVIIDYMQLIQPDKKQRTSEEDISYVSGSITSMVRQLNVAGITLAQLNRENEKEKSRRPRLSDLRGSGSLEQDADTVAFLWYPGTRAKDDEKDKGEVGGGDKSRSWEDVRDRVNVCIEKQRNGPIGEAYFIFYKSCLRMEECQKADEPYDIPVSYSQFLPEDYGSPAPARKIKEQDGGSGFDEVPFV